MTKVVNKSRVTQSSTTITDDGYNDAKSLELRVQPQQQEIPVNVAPTMTVQQLNEVVAEAGDMPKLTPKQIKKQEEAHKRHMNSMITRAQAQQMVDEATAQYRENLQILFLQVQSVFEMLTDKDITTPEEMEKYTQVVVEGIYGKPPVEEEVSEDARDNGSDNNN
jgi:hypothetical protein